ncbi:OVARIAN TUMOR DOMAIN-containing deubiquitinating enzyme 4 isoform X3 [Manihot esculenta]|uniref:OVARIAN TUMOR DOMAIN-containing deubiquitinating enzyme 4 isoform X3 n=1 Tax=Manihot esculenta TaxID=3983 RepID=UPI001CC3E819|nr:OVARIAN TUMOR DOMAIN-containing deubiquitinating enzyme 4 isoform X3 [Manihot esculenta]
MASHSDSQILSITLHQLKKRRTRFPWIPGDGRCLFRSVVHGACLRSGKPSPTESLEKELADELRSKVADEFIKRRGDTEWFLEDDFDTYVRQMRQPHVWGGEPELLMASHVLKVPITVYMRDRNSGGLKIIAEYGQEYGRENPICVLYHGYGHYDALRRKIAGSQSKQFLRWISGGLIHQGYKAEGEKMLIV